jgi:DNA-binding protein HU-beta
LILNRACNSTGVNMNRKELISVLAAKTGSSKADADRHVIALIEAISDTLLQGGKINLNGFGNFEVRERAERVGRNPRTGEIMKIKATRVPAFKAGGTLKASLNKSQEV